MWVQRILVNVVEPEFNVLHLQLDGNWWSIYGGLGSEYLTLHMRTEDVKEEILGCGNWVGSLAFLDCFLDKKIVAIRQMGEAWNGHGFEFGFEGLLDTTLLVQSIYTGTEPENFNDCIRIGIGKYVHEIYKAKS